MEGSSYRFVLAAALALVTGASPAALPLVEPPVATLHVDGDLVIDATGAVTSYHVTSSLPPDFAHKIEEVARTLRFEPVLVDGKAVRAQTRMRLTLAGPMRDNGDVEARVDNVTFPGEEGVDAMGEAAPGLRMRVSHRAPTLYPESAARQGLDAEVLVVVKVGLDGRIEDAAVRQSTLLEARAAPALVAKVLQEFERETLRSVRRWRVDVQVDPGAHPDDRDRTALVKFSYHVMGTRQAGDGQWRWETRSSKRQAPWLAPEPSEMLVGVSDVDGDGLARDSGRFHLTAPLQQTL
jgi:hypothetical protein